MGALYIGTYDIVDANEFQKYPPIVIALLPKYGGEVLAALFPFGALKNVGADFDQAREHFKDGDWGPRGALSGTESAAVDFVGDAGVGAFLDNEFHEQEKEFALDGIFL